MDNNFFPVSSISLILFLCHFIKLTVCFDDPAYLTGDVSIDCGSVGSSAAAHNGRQWLGDANPRFASSVQIRGKSTISSVARGFVSADRVPYKTARISRSGFSYIFLVNPGEKIIRLHFNPTPYKGFRKFKDLFTVETGPFTLLGNFSASLTADALGLSFIIKEFCISVEENQPLHIVFTPASSQSGDTFAFLNGIEIITVPLGHSYFHDDGDIGAQVVGHKSQQIYVDNSTALEMVRRVNIKRDSDDISDMFDMWTTLPRVKANSFNNMTWKLSIDVGFRYLIRFHFSDLGLKFVQETSAMNFEILVNEVTAYNNMDFVSERDADKFNTYKDYIVMLKGRKEGVKHDILVSLQSYGKFIDGYGPFMGFEILKLSNLENSLASPNPLPPARDLPSSSIHTLHAALDHRNTILTISITIIALANIIVHKVREIFEASYTEDENKPSSRAERFCRRFSLAEMQLATRNFCDHLIIGKGGFGKVYRGLIDHHKEAVAIKRLKAYSSQGAHEFLTEIETLSELRHINLVSLIGYCNEQREMILVYEYMAGGTLGDHLYKLARKGNSCASLTWKQRLNICIGAGRALDYLHTGHGVIHRDVKVSNILLDENFKPKVSDFGLVKHENLTNLQSHVSTKVKGTFGYLDPTYFSTGRLTRRSDTYSFGVVLLEVLCGRPALDKMVSEAEQILTKWARDKIREGEVELIVASNLKKEISPNSLKAFVEIVERCLDDEPKKRPTMAQVVLQLEFSLEQQDIVESSVPKEIMIDAPICTDKKNLSAGEQATWIAANTPTSPPKERTNNQIGYDDLSYRRKKGRKVSSYKPFRILPWDVLWNRVKPSWKNNNSISGVNSSKMASGDGTELSNSSIEASSASVLPDPRSESEISQSSNLKSFTFSDLKGATRNFRPDCLLGVGSFGSVFKGWIDDQSLAASRPGSGMAIAVKRLNQEGWQGHMQWLTEINYLGQLRHPNIVNLIGYCLEEEQRLLVYEFMSKSSVENQLFRRGSCFQPLSWSLRMKIALGAARGLAFLHGAKTRVIYRDFKTSNILLDSYYNAKLSDFGLARDGPTGDMSHVSTKVMGTHGYAAPEYIATGCLTVKSDVYSFGVVLLEILSGKKVIERNRPSGEHNLVDWAKPYLTNKRKIFRVIDIHVKGQYTLERVMKAANLALQCLSNDARSRPNMDNVVAVLEQLQDSKDTSKN